MRHPLRSPIRIIQPSDRRGIPDGGVAPPRNTPVFLVVAPCPRGAAAPGLGRIISTRLLTELEGAVLGREVGREAMLDQRVVLEVGQGRDRRRALRL